MISENPESTRKKIQVKFQKSKKNKVKKKEMRPPLTVPH